MKFRKKPVVIEATQWFPGIEIEGVVTEIKMGMPADIWEMVRDDGKGAIHTLEGWHIVSPGDWVITGVNGEKCPCKPDIFEKTYEPEE